MKISLHLINTSKGSSLSSLTEKTSASIFCVPAIHFKNLFLFFSFLLFAFWANATTYYSKATGNANTLATWGINADGTGTAPTNFTTSGDIFILRLASALTTNNNWTIGIGVTLQMDGTLAINGNADAVTINGTVIFTNLTATQVSMAGAGSGNSFIVSSGATLKTKNNNGVQGANCSVPVNVSKKTVTLSTSANYEFNGTSTQATLGLPSTVNTLTINNTAGVSLTASVTVTTLTIGNVTANSIFNDNGNQITSTGTFNLTSGTFNVGTGSTLAAATSYPAFGTNNIASGTTVNYNSSYSGGQTIAAVNYFNLSSTANGPRTLPGTGTVGIAGTLSPGAGNYTVTSGNSVSFNGASAQTIPSINPAATFSFFNLAVNNPGGISSIATDVKVANSFALTKGIVTTGANKIIIASGGFVSRPATGGWVFGNLQKAVNLGSNPPFDFEIGDASNYTPVTINYAVVTTAGSLIATVTTSPSSHPAIASSGLDNTKTVTRYWTLTKVGSLAGNYDATFTYNSGSVPGIANTNNFVVREYNASAWVTPVPATGTKTATSTQATGLTAYGDFCVGESTGAPTVAVNPAATSAICEGGSTTFTSSSSSIPTPTIQWQRSNDNGSSWDDIATTTDGGGKYTNFTTGTLNIANTVTSMTGYLYRAKFTNINGSAFSSSAGGKLIVSILPVITTMTYPSATFSTASPAQSGPAFTGSNYTGGTFSVSPSSGLAGFNASTGAFTPIGSTINSYTITYTITNGACSPVSKSTTVDISSAAISYAQSAYCSTDATARPLIFSGFTANPAAIISVSAIPGSANLNNTATGTFTPSSADPGVYTVTYTDGSVVLSTTVTVTQLPAATISYSNSNICNLDGAAYPVSYTGTTGAYTGGIFSYTPTVVGRILNIVASGGTVANPLGSITGVGSAGDVYNVVYTIPASGGCPTVATSPTAVTITAIPAATLTYGTAGYPICKASSSISPTLTGLPGGGIFTQPVGQTGLSVNAAGVIDPATSTPGTYNMIYTVNSGTSCGDVSITSANIKIDDNPSLTISYSAPSFCTGDGTKAVTFSGTGSSAGAIFSAAPAGLSIAPATGLITPSLSTAAAGSPYLVTATIPNCPLPTPITAFFEIDPSPTASISYSSAAYCELDGAQYPVTITGATGGQFTYTSVPAGLTLNIDQPSGGSITPSGSNPGTYTITYTVTVGTCTTTANTTVVITPKVGTVVMSLGASSTEPACEITASTPTTTYTASAANNSGYTWSISPAGAGSISAGGVVTWTVGFSGTVTITVIANGCSGSTTTDTRQVIVNPNNTVSAASSTPTLCVNTALTDITHSTTGATGIGAAIGLPAGVTASWSANTITISGTPTASGTFNYTVPLTGGCSTVSATGTITVSPNNTVGAASSTPTLCINTALTNITHATTGATGIGSVTGLPAGVTAAWATNTITISGTPSVTGTFNYTIPLTGGCSTVNATGTITVNANNTVGAASSTPTLCINTPLTSITHTTTGATGIGAATGLPAGVTVAWATNTITISGIPTASGIFNYSIPLTGGCSTISATGTINVNASSVGGTLSPALKTECTGANSATITLGGTVVGSVIKWEQSTDFGTTWTTVLPNNTTTSLTYTNLTQTTFYRAVVQSNSCSSANSAYAQVIVNPAFTATISASALATCVSTPVTLTASGYSSTGLVIPGGDFSDPAAGSFGWTGMNGNASNNNTATDFIWGYTNPGHQYSGNTYSSTSGTGGSFFLVAGTPPTNPSILTTPAFSTIGLSTAVLVFNEAYVLQAGTTAKVEISTDGGASYTTLKTYTGVSSQGPTNGMTFLESIDINVYLGRSNLKIRFNYSGSANSVWAIDNVVVTNSVANPSGVNAYNPLTYTWSSSAPTLSSTSANPITFTPASSGSATINLSTQAGTCAPTASTPISITINPLAQGTLTANGPFCGTGAGQLTFTATAGTGPFTVVYNDGVANRTVNNVVSGTPFNVFTTPVIATTTYTLVSVTDTKTCSRTTGFTGAAATITINPLPTNVTVSGGGTFCGSTTITAANGGSGTIYFQGTTSGGTSTATPSTSQLISASGTYYFRAQSALGCWGAEGSVIVTINPLPTTVTVSGAGTFCGSTTVTAANGGSGTIYFQGTTSGGTSIATPSASQLISASGTYYFRARSAAGCWGVEGSVIVVINPTPTITLMATTVCGGGAATITATPTPGVATDYTYVWTGPTNPGNTPPFTTTTTGSYTVVITNIATGCVSAPSAAVNVTAAANTWTGAIDNDWQKPGNWSCAAIPTALTDVIVPVVTNQPKLTAASFTKTLTLQGTAEVDLNGFALTNSGAVTMGSGAFIGSLTSDLTFNAAGSSAINFKQVTDGISNALNNLTINSAGATVTLNNKVALYGALTPTAGTLTLNDTLILRSTSAGTARVGVVGGTINYVGVGRVTVERYYQNRGWKLITGPVYEGGTIYDNWQNKGIMSDVAPGKGTLITGTVIATPANGLDGGSTYLNSSLKQGIGNGALLEINNTKAATLSKAGISATNIPYFLFVRGDRNLANFTPYVFSPTVLSSTGKLQTGPQSFPADPTVGSFTMIGNPYASPVDFGTLPRTNLTNFLYTWNPYQNTTGAYITFIESPIGSGSYFPVPAGSPGNPSTTIQSGQAFYINNPGGVASLVFSESNKSTNSNPGGVFRPMSPAASMPSLATNLYAFTNKDSMFLADGNLAQFDDSYNPGVDWMDAKKMTNTNETFGLLCNGVSLAADRRPLLKMSDTVFYKLTKTTAKKYQFQLVATNLDKDNLAGFVQDQFTHTATPMNMNGTTKINFEVTSNKGSAAADRFRVVFKPSVVYTNLAANVLAGDIGVQWGVANEENIRGYEIERSTDGTHFTKVADQASAGNTESTVSYNWLDVEPALGQYYYRIRSISNNDVTGYSNIVKVKLNRSTPAIYVFPNPVTENTIHLQMNGMAKGKYGTRLLNSLGQVISASYINHLAGTATESVQPVNKLLSGVYQLEITAPNNITTTVKLMVK